MTTISATVKTINRAIVPCPDDGVHVSGKDGFIKGCNSLWFGDVFVPKGQTAFYWAPEASHYGLRVSYSFGWLKPISERLVRREYKIMRKCWKMGISPEPKSVEKVKLKLYYEKDKKKIGCCSYAIRVQNLFYPKGAWQKYAEGYPYDWSAVDHPDHSPEGFKKFVAAAKVKAGKLISTSWKLGDVIWCVVNNRWYLVDPGK